ncbi:conserved hypothetical protein [Verticillium alfalfae VaMs.102]|uniref:RecF/RecN/SMC N-terminal domain-containing protein n=1 Tax=Verticillium alfalfae (strain VaMs.102 / ATCC MYA-4576 / FGSC 10136) TaxID=526221 RepID=C9SXS5_VERA1|nr:conserved hypothetical protein [Verticillium alfalfae VaMs.102]EEY23590.1 conserved hypothetical protein [Verticillium alfalfae VaMs.102]
MSSLKRSHRAISNLDSANGTGVEQASSSFSNDAARKRVRVSVGRPVKPTAPREPSAVSEESEQSEQSAGEESRNGRDSPPRTQYEIMRDGGFRHLENEELDDQRATQAINARSHRVGDNRAAENGIIENVECINFMCHERLYVELGPLINFIVGENGSGKSAVLTALTLCLGAKASSTNRGGSLKSFIKEGRDQAVITVCIKNQGQDAYQPDLYGETIRVERHFSRSGTSGFRLKSERGKTISTKKAEIDEITEYWGLQVDNPLNVLSQDNARQFLNSATPAVKYKYFFKGVQLEQLDHNYKLISEMLDSHEEKLVKLKDDAAQLEVKYQRAKKDKQAVEANLGLRAEGQRIRTQLAWCQVVDAERGLAQQQAQLEALTSKLVEDARNIDKATGQLTTCDEKIEQLEACCGGKEAKAKLEDHRREEREAHAQIKNARASVASWKEKIAAEEQRLGEESGSARQKLQEQLDEANAEEARLQHQILEGNAQLPILVKESDAAAEHVTQCEKRLNAKGKEVQDARGRIQNLQSNNRSPYAAFDPKIPQLLKAIERDDGFERRPVGPVGLHMQLLKPVWSSILETTFGQFLNSFLVVNKQDQRRLVELMRQIGIRNVPVTIGKPLPPGTKLKEPDGQFLTILRALKIEDDWVRDQLIVNYMIEKIILVERREDAEDIMYGSEGPPRDVSVSLSLHDRKRNQGIRIQVRPSGISTSTVSEFKRAPRMKSDVETQIGLHEETLRLLDGEFQELRKEKATLETARRHCHEQVTRLRQTNDKLEAAITKIAAKITNLNEENDQYEGADGRLAQYQEELKLAELDKEHHGTQYGELHVKRDSLNKEVEEQKRKLNHEKEKIKDLEAQLNKVDRKLQQARDLRQMAVVAKNTAYDTQAETETLKHRAEQECAYQAQAVAECTEGASAQSPNPQAASGTHRRTDEQINDRLREAKAAFLAASQEFESQQSFQQDAKRSLADRLVRWRHFQQHISAHSRINFRYLLSERGFRGNISRQWWWILQLSVEPDETRKNAGGRSTKTLSGGEKSFSSICMLLAIWEAMGSPLRCLDEFDVFMDNVNRTISTKMLIDAARRSVSRQYIMITPNAIEGRASLGKDVNIIRLTDPRQRTLPQMT